jgi:hypothetical protein
MGTQEQEILLLIRHKVHTRLLAASLLLGKQSPAGPKGLAALRNHLLSPFRILFSNFHPPAASSGPTLPVQAQDSMLRKENYFKDSFSVHNLDIYISHSNQNLLSF